MKKQIGAVTLAAILCCGIQMQGADVSAPSATQVRDEAQQLLKERDEARLKADAAVEQLRRAGRVRSAEELGFAGAKRVRDQEARSGSKTEAYERYAKTAKQLEKKTQKEVMVGTKPVLMNDIARFERLQAEVDLARITGRLPAVEK